MATKKRRRKKAPTMRSKSKQGFNTADLTGHEWASYESPYRHRPKRPKAYRINTITGTVPKVQFVDTKAKAQKALAALEEPQFGWVAVDTEYDPTSFEMVSWQFSTGYDRWVIDHKKATRYFRRWLQGDATKILSNAYADVPVFKANGVVLGGKIVDTVVLDWLVDENRKRHGLKYCAQDWLNLPLTDYEDAFGFIPQGKKKVIVPDIHDIYENQFKRFLEYASLDAYATFWLAEHHRAVLINLGLWDVYDEHDSLFTRTLLNMYERGMAIDIDVLHAIGFELDKTMARSRFLFANYAPPTTVIRTRFGAEYAVELPPEKINLKSPQQLSALFYDELGCETVSRNDPECRSTNEEHLVRWSEDGNILAELLLTHRRAATMRGTFIGDADKKGLLSHVEKVVDQHGAYYRITTAMKQAGTVSGRLASSKPNLQNIPNRKEKDPYRMRRAFIARKGCKLVVADYSGAELRVMAHMSRDREMLRAFKKGLDLHSVTTQRIFNLKCPVEEIKYAYPDLRNRGKAINFGLQYGMKAWLLAKQIGVDVKEAEKYIDAYFDHYQGVYRWMIRMVEQCKKRGYVMTILGRRRRIPEIKLDEDEYKGKVNHAKNQAMNTPIQGSVADIIKIAMNDIDKDEYLKDHEARLLLQVHDELVVECPEVDAYSVAPRVQHLMQEAAVKAGMSLPLPAEPGVGDNWEEAKV